MQGYIYFLCLTDRKGSVFAYRLNDEIGHQPPVATGGFAARNMAA
jgi:hypothetical protein